MRKNDTDGILELKFPSAPRRRPSMYLGDQGRQMTTGFREITDNAVTESLKGHADKILVVFRKDGSYVVQDNGRGLPVDTNKAGKNGIILTMATLHAGGNFENSTTGKNGPGLNGVGGSVVNALSARFSVTVYKNNKKYRLDFKEGIAGFFKDGKNGYDVNSPFERSEKIAETKDTRTRKEKTEFPTGTIIHWTFDSQCFPDGEQVNIDEMVDRLKYTVYIVPGLKIRVVDETRTDEDGNPLTWDFYGEGGIKEMCSIISSDNVLDGTQQNRGDDYEKAGIFYFKTTGKYKARTGMMNDDGTTTFKQVDREIPIELALRWNDGFDTDVRSFVNTIQTIHGGVHEEALSNALTTVFSEKMGSMRGLGVGKNSEKPTVEDYFEGLTAVLSINVLEPQFSGQQKEKLSGPAVKKAVTQALKTVFEGFVDAPSNRKHVEAIFRKAIDAMRTRKAAEEAKKVRQVNKKLTNTTAMPEKLRDCSIIGTDESELFICEGDSAAATIAAARIAEYQAVLPIRGKIPNVLKCSVKEIMENAEISDIIKCLGAGSGKYFNISEARYGRVFFAADADYDGFHINTLLTALFYRLFRPMILEGRVYQAVSPLFEIHTKTKTFYAADDAEMLKIVTRLDKNGTKYNIQRSKGLGELDKEVFHDVVLDPANRKVKRITLPDVKAASDALELTLGTNADARKDWMTDNYQVAIDSGLVEA